MNRKLRLVTTGLLLAAPFAYLACGSDDDAAGPGATSDASTSDANATTPGTDASTDVTVRGDDGTDANAGQDANGNPQADAALDGGSDAAVTMTTLDGIGHARAGVTVVVHDSTGAPITTLTSNDAGVATATVPAGGMVTAIYGATVNSRLFTITGVQPGDALTTRDPVIVTGSFSVQVTAPANPPSGTASYVLEYGYCQGETLMGTAPTFTAFDASAYCLPSTTATFVLRALNSAKAELGYSTLYNFQLTGPGANALAFTGWSTAIPQTVALSHVPTSLPSGSYDVTSAAVNGPGAWESVTQSTALDAGSISVLTRPAGASFQQTGVTLYDYFKTNNDRIATRTLVTRAAVPTGPTTTSFDFSTMLPEITDAGFTQPDGSAAQIAWSSAAALTTTSGIYVEMGWTGNGGGGAAVGTWTMLLPPSATTATFPKLPTALAGFAPGSTATYAQPPGISAMTGTSAPTFAALRGLAGVLALPSTIYQGNFASGAPELPVDGTLNLTAFTLNSD